MGRIQNSIFIISTSVLLGLGGCGTVVSSSNYALSKAIVKDSDRLNDAYNKATNGVIVKNILRARDRVPINFTTLSGIQSRPQITSTNALGLSPIGLGNPSGPFQGSNDTITNQVQSLNQYNINPFAGGGGRTESLLFDVSESTFERYWNGWPKDVVFLLFIESVSTGEQDLKPCKNSGSKFYKFEACLKSKIPTHDSIDFNKMHFDLPRERKNRLKELGVSNKNQVCNNGKIDLETYADSKDKLEALEKMMATFNFNLKLVGTETKGKGQDKVVKPVFDLCRDIDKSGKIFVYDDSKGGGTEFSVTYLSLIHI